MKQFINRSFAFVVVLCYSIGALFYLYFDVSQIGCKLAAHQNISESTNLEVLKMPLQDYTERAGQDEIWYNNRLYDIRTVTIVGNTVYVSVFHDEHEETLVKNVSDSFESGSFATNNNTDHITKHTSQHIDESKMVSDGFALTPVLFEANPKYLSANNYLYYPAVHSSVVKPPPRFV